MVVGTNRSTNPRYRTKVDEVAWQQFLLTIMLTSGIFDVVIAAVTVTRFDFDITTAYYLLWVEPTPWHASTCSIIEILLFESRLRLVEDFLSSRTRWVKVIFSTRKKRGGGTEKQNEKEYGIKSFFRCSEEVHSTAVR